MRYLKRRKLVALALLLVGGGTVGVLVAFRGGNQPQALFASMVAASRVERSVHIVDVESGWCQRKPPSTTVANAGRHEGIIQTTFRSHGRTYHQTKLRIGKMTYLRGDAFVLRNPDLVGWSRKRASRYANKWIAIPPSSPYAGFGNGATLGSKLPLASNYPHGLTLVSKTLDGRRLVGVRWFAHGRKSARNLVWRYATYSDATGNHLPVEDEISIVSPGYSGCRDTLMFGPWNRPVAIRPPARAIPLSTVLQH